MGDRGNIHTQGPWRAIPLPNGEEWEIVGPEHIDDQDCQWIATTAGGLGENTLNGDHIVECVNAFEPGGKVAALIEASKWILTWDVAESTEIDPDYQRLAAELRAALAALGEG